MPRPATPPPLQAESRPQTQAGSRADGRRDRVGLSIFDLDVVHPVVRKRLLGGKLALSKDQTALVDGDAVVPLTCGLLEAAVVADLLRGECRRVGEKVPRAYLSSAQAWRRLPEDAVLTEMTDGRPELSDRWFPPKPGEVEFLPPEFGPVV